MSHPYKSKCSDAQSKGRSQYAAGGGKIVSIPFSVSKTADALKRLHEAGKTAGKTDQLRDFTASRLSKEGYDYKQILGPEAEAKYKRGGKA